MKTKVAALAAVLVLLLLLAVPIASAKVVNENTNDLPPGCEEIAGERSITVRGGREHAEGFPGTVFTFDERSWDIPGCTRVTVTFINDDPTRHQFMVHDTYPAGFFQIELAGEGEETGTFILGPDEASLLIHCGVSQHQQKGMKAQFLVGGGIGDLPNIVGVSGIPPQDRGPSDPAPDSQAPAIAAVWVLVALAAVAGAFRHR